MGNEYVFEGNLVSMADGTYTAQIVMAGFKTAADAEHFAFAVRQLIEKNLQECGLTEVEPSRLEH